MPRAGSTTQRGYGVQHVALRAELAPAVERGEVNCWRCGRPIKPGQAWDLGHDDHDRTLYRGPEHARRSATCRGNRSVGASHGQRRRALLKAAKVTRFDSSRQW